MSSGSVVFSGDVTPSFWNRYQGNSIATGSYPDYDRIMLRRDPLLADLQQDLDIPWHSHIDRQACTTTVSWADEGPDFGRLQASLAGPRASAAMCCLLMVRASLELTSERYSVRGQAHLNSV